MNKSMEVNFPICRYRRSTRGARQTVESMEQDNEQDRIFWETLRDLEGRPEIRLLKHYSQHKVSTTSSHSHNVAVCAHYLAVRWKKKVSMQKESGSDDKPVAARPCRWQVPDQVQAEDFADPALYRHLAGIQDQIQQALRQSQYRARAKECGQLAQYDEMIKAARRTEREKQRERRGEGAEEKRAEGT